MSKRANYFQVHLNKRCKKLPPKQPDKKEIKFMIELFDTLTKNGIEWRLK